MPVTPFAVRMPFGRTMGQIARIALLTLVMSCPIFTVLFAFDLGLWTQLLATVTVAVGISLAIVVRAKR